MRLFEKQLILLIFLALFEGKTMASDFIEVSRVTNSTGGVSVNEDYISLSAVGQSYHTSTTIGEDIINHSGFINTLIPKVDLEKGLVAYYPFNGNANDDSGNGNHGEVKGATLTEDRFGIADSSYELVADDVITVSNPFDGMQSFTKSLWFRVDNIADHWGLLQSSACGIKIYRNSFAVYFNDSRTNSSYSPKHRYYADFKQDQIKTWNHLILSAKNDDEFSMYLNGIKLEVGEKNSSGVEAWGNNPLLIGYMRGGSPRSLDDIRIYNRALSEAEVAELYKLEKPVGILPPPPSEYKIIEGSFTWHEAKADAEARGGHLATITSEAEQAYIGDLVSSSDIHLWLGGTDEDSEGNWTWVTEEIWEYNNWFLGGLFAGQNAEPSNGGELEHHLHILGRSSLNGIPVVKGQWNDAPSSGQWNDAPSPIKGYILEIPNVDLERGLVAYYPFNGNANDESGNGNDFTHLSGVELTDDRAGDSQSAVRLIYQDSYAQTSKNVGIHGNSAALGGRRP